MQDDIKQSLTPEPTQQPAVLNDAPVQPSWPGPATESATPPPVSNIGHIQDRKLRRRGLGSILAGVIIIAIFLLWRGFVALAETNSSGRSFLARFAASLIFKNPNSQSSFTVTTQPIAPSGQTGSPGQPGASGAKGDTGDSGSRGIRGSIGLQGPSGSSTATCQNGDCLSLQSTSPGVQETGSINLSGNALIGGGISAGQLQTSAAGWLMSRDSQSDATIRSFASYNGKLYVGRTTYNPGGGDISVYDGSSWSTSFDTSTYTVAQSLAVYNGRLYAGMGSGVGQGDIIVCNPASTGDATTCDNGDWSLVYDGSNNYITSFATYNGKLYAAASYSGFVYVCDPAISGDPTQCDSGDWSTSLNSGTTYVHALAVYNGSLYAGLGSDNVAGTGDVMAYNGTAWTKSYDGSKMRISALAVSNGKLYAGQADNSAGSGNILSFDGTSWTTVYTGSKIGITALADYDGKLYAGQLGLAAGDGDVLVYDGTGTTISYAGTQEMIETLGVYNGTLYAGQGIDAGDGDIFSYSDATEAQLVVSPQLTTNKALVIKSIAGQSADLLQVQNSSGGLLDRLDANGNLSVKALLVQGSITVGGHIVTTNSSGLSTTIAIRAGCGSGCTASISGNDTAGLITINTGTGPTTGLQAFITFASTFDAVPQIELTPQAVQAASNFPQYYATPSETGFGLQSYNALSPSVSYSFSYHAEQ